MRTAIILSALLLTACGSRQHSVRESAELDFNKQVCLKDFSCGDFTLPAIHTFAYPNCGELLRKIAADLQSGMRCREEATAEISKLIEDADGYGYTMRLISGYCEEAIRALDVYRNSEAKHCLKRIAESVREGAEYLMDNCLC